MGLSHSTLHRTIGLLARLAGETTKGGSVTGFLYLIRTL